MVHQEVDHLQEESVAAEVVAVLRKTMLLVLLLTREGERSLLGVKAEEAREAIGEEALVEVATPRGEDRRRLALKISLICFLVDKQLRNKMLLRFLELQMTHWFKTRL